MTRKSAAGAMPASVRKLRCAIYTRKSTDEGLEKAFNTLDAQRDACEAYASSQRAEGWTLLPDQYDDGGFSGATLERPAVQLLLRDIEAGRVDVVVVYKIDRLSRALMDFARLVELFDAHAVTFVSVTQSFNTTTSMGRLTLNILLSFAQFEREVIGERIRDKFAASRARGMWMGGRVPLGYDVKNRRLVVNPAEVATVRRIFEGFVATGSGTRLAEMLRAEGVTRRLYRYYVSQSVLKCLGENDPALVRRVPAAEIEALVVAQVRALLRQPELVVGTWQTARADDAGVTDADAVTALEQFEPLWDELFPAEQARIVQLLVERVEVGPKGADIRLRVEGLKSLALDLSQTSAAA